jgi:hypothetical protein
MPASEKIQPLFKIVEVDATTFFEDRFREEHSIKAITDRYLYDERQVTYCCSAAPMYTMHYIGCYAEFLEPTDQDMYEDAHEQILIAASTTDPITYMRAYDIDSISDDRKEAVETPDEDYECQQLYDDVVEELVEEYWEIL